MVYWEIASNKLPCPNGVSQSCLKVRPVSYDDSGIEKEVGAWQIFVDNIEGYQHNNRHNQIVRLKRFTVNPVDVKGNQFVYEFDTVVERKVVN